ncbi:cytotoxic and regulatory T-cell molecule [Tachyglossus aculeatus]|uniref:cytotoxic and regulatory T-cell molecule n=1 Tax=Tachyglossus aculeatus TaxID=9261 RepID=UPI0018F3EFD3|nr:cytotoxic and regulatory T-cell molecule [Tachyglossus aculeatus]
MTLLTVFCLLAWFPLQQEAFLTYRTETFTIVEGRTLTLKCAIPRADKSSLQWMAPTGFTIFFNQQKVLKDHKYKLTHHSKDHLSISVSNVTVQDEGVYRCLYYTKPVRTKKVTVIVIAPPSKPTLEVLAIRTPHREEVLLKCFTTRSKPSPQITWLMDNGLEVFGETKHIFEHNGKRCNTTSTLTVLTYRKSSVISCIVRHKALQGGNLTTSFRFEDLGTTGAPPTTTMPTTNSPANTQDRDFTTHSTLNSTPPTPPDYKSEGPWRSSTPEMKTQQNDLQNNTTPVTEEFNHPAIVTINIESTTQKYNLTNETNPMPEEMMKKSSGILLLTLVSFLILILLIIVQLFIMKLRKAHVIWKKENEISEQTLESYKSRSNNEDTPHQEKYGQISSQKGGTNYITAINTETESKKPTETTQAIHHYHCQDSSAEKGLDHLPETTV